MRWIGSSFSFSHLMGGSKGLPHKQTMRTKLFLRRSNTTNIEILNTSAWSRVNNVRYIAIQLDPLISRTRLFQTQDRTISLGFALQRSFTIGYLELPLFRTTLRESSIRSSEQDPIRSVFIFYKHKRATLPFSKKFDQTRSKNNMIV